MQPANQAQASATAETPDAAANIDLDNPIVRRAVERVRLRQEQGVHAVHTTKHSSHSTHSKGSW